ncbi:hypothetical protein TeGR_g11499 [Tetraparma gracilis]|uniref:Uncharacterized protein n=1 Tax=Tetraparma gracilis TaxID=2962635 RepID=A0ABQ6MD56_9STRA|nr:hypothetical protein TeGR_g11499 [Tetraparma gracilis]
MIVFLGVFMLSPTSKDDDAVSLGDDPDQNEQMVDRARGFSWDGPQQMNPNQRMVSVWGSTNDDVVAKVLDNDPLAKLEKATHRAVEKSVMKHQKRATMKVRSPSIPQARKSGAVEKYEDAGTNI